MRRFTWIHLSDLHYGSLLNNLLWPDAGDLLYRDLVTIFQQFEEHGATRIDAIFFSGDLTYSGKKEQFLNADIILNSVSDIINRHYDHRPALLAVPGNHDLNHDPKSSHPFLFALSKGYHDAASNFREDFWGNDRQGLRDFVVDKFSDYNYWWNSVKNAQKHLVFKDGFMPGDFSTVLLTSDSLRIGVIGLNSSFLQLTCNDLYDHLDLHEIQLTSVCDPDYAVWCRANDVNFLLTHHGFNPYGRQFFHSSALKRYKEIFNNPFRIYSHLCGHLHRSIGTNEGMVALENRKYRIAPSLFGLNTVNETDSQRIHGYTAGMLILDDEKVTELLWPRIAAKDGGGSLQIIPDNWYRFKPGTIYVEDITHFPEKPGVSLGDELKQKRLEMVGEEIYNKINIIEDKVTMLWNLHFGPPWNKLHNSSHNRKVEFALYQLIPKSKKDLLKPEEWLCLLSSVWLHEIGMIVGLFDDDRLNIQKSYGTDTFYEHVRKIHHQRCTQFLENNSLMSKYSMTFAENELNAIKSICSIHRKSSGTKLISKNRHTGIRVDLLAAYLKLSLAIHIDESSSNEEYYQLLESMSVTWEDLFHWKKVNWIKNIIPNPETLSIVMNYYGIPESSPAFGFMPKAIVNELETLIKGIQDLLIRGQISNYIDIIDNHIDQLQEDNLRDMELIYSNTRIEELSSASEAYSTVLESIKRFADYPSAYSLIKRYVKGIENVLNKRPCHNLIHNCVSKLNQLLSQNADTVNIVNTIRSFVNDKIELRKREKDAISLNARPFLTDCGSILLFGYSSTVRDSLIDLPKDVKEKTSIYIGECRGKSQFNDNNQIIYNDGLYYARAVKAIGFTNVNVIPDISIGNLMKRGKISKILFGANGIDRKTGAFGHTCGHLSVADLAKEYKVPVYVIADTGKFGKLQWEEDLNREISWLTKDPIWAEDVAIVGKVNPREDLVASEKIKMLITEIGAFPPDTIPESIKA